MKKIPKRVYKEIINALDIAQMDYQGMQDEKTKAKRLKSIEKAKAWIREVGYCELGRSSNKKVYF